MTVLSSSPGASVRHPGDHQRRAVLAVWVHGVDLPAGTADDGRRPSIRNATCPSRSSPSPANPCSVCTLRVRCSDSGESTSR
jgi:hypothetical protein